MLIHCIRGFTYANGYVVRILYILYIFEFRPRDIPYVGEDAESAYSCLCGFECLLGLVGVYVCNSSCMRVGYISSLCSWVY